MRVTSAHVEKLKQDLSSCCISDFVWCFTVFINLELLSSSIQVSSTGSSAPSSAILVAHLCCLITLGDEGKTSLHLKEHNQLLIWMNEKLKLTASKAGMGLVCYQLLNFWFLTRNDLCWGSIVDLRCMFSIYALGSSIFELCHLSEEEVGPGCLESPLSSFLDIPSSCCILLYFELHTVTLIAENKFLAPHIGLSSLVLFLFTLVLELWIVQLIMFDKSKDF